MSAFHNSGFWSTGRGRARPGAGCAPGGARWRRATIRVIPRNDRALTTAWIPTLVGRSRGKHNDNGHPDSRIDVALRAIAGVTRAARPNPADTLAPDDAALSEDERRHVAGLMRINHVGEVCAQALYQAQKLTARTPAVRTQMDTAAREEEDHLAWCADRLRELGSRPSLLNPLWYAGAFAIGWAAGRAGDRVSLGFVAETEQ